MEKHTYNNFLNSLTVSDFMALIVICGFVSNFTNYFHQNLKWTSLIIFYFTTTINIFNKQNQIENNCIILMEGHSFLWVILTITHSTETFFPEKTSLHSPPSWYMNYLHISTNLKSVSTREGWRWTNAHSKIFLARHQSFKQLYRQEIFRESLRVEVFGKG